MRQNLLDRKAAVASSCDVSSAASPSSRLSPVQLASTPGALAAAMPFTSRWRIILPTLTCLSPHTKRRGLHLPCRQAECHAWQQHLNAMRAAEMWADYAVLSI